VIKKETSKNTPNRATKLLIKQSVFASHKKLVVGLSGGPDSVCLLHQLVALQKMGKISLIAVHLDHEWRAESYKDAEFCQKLCEELSVPLISKKSSELHYTAPKNGSREDEGRNLRRYLFETVLKEYGADAIVLAHHADDQRETFFIRLTRGTTLTGLCSMKEQDGLYIRPLLHVSKLEIIDFLKEHTLSWIEDASNNSDDYLRNRIRNHLIPALQKCDQRAETQLSRLIASLQDTESFLEKLTAKTFNSVVSGQLLNIAVLKTIHPVLQKRVLTLWICMQAPTFTLTESFLDEIMRFLESPRGGTHQLGTSWCIVKKQNTAKIFIF